jgi:rubredoxin
MIIQRLVTQFIKQIKMRRYVCSGCYFTYDPEIGLPKDGILPGTAFADIPDSWICPDCGLSKAAFREYRE